MGNLFNALYGTDSGRNLATKDQFRLNLLLYRKVGNNLMSDYYIIRLTISTLLTN